MLIVTLTSRKKDGEARLAAFDELEKWFKFYSKDNYPAVLMEDFNIPRYLLNNYISKNFPTWMVTLTYGNVPTYFYDFKSSYIDHIFEVSIDDKSIRHNNISNCDIISTTGPSKLSSFIRNDSDYSRKNDYKRILVDDENNEYVSNALKIIINEVENYEYLYGEILNNINSKIINTKFTESYENSLYRNFYNFMREVGKGDKHVDLSNIDNDEKTGRLDFFTIYKDDNGNPIKNDCDTLFNSIGNTLIEIMDEFVQEGIEYGYIKEDENGDYIILDDTKNGNLLKRNLNMLYKNFYKTNSTVNLEKRKTFIKRQDPNNFEIHIENAVQAIRSLQYGKNLGKEDCADMLNSQLYMDYNTDSDKNIRTDIYPSVGSTVIRIKQTKLIQGTSQLIRASDVYVGSMPFNQGEVILRFDTKTSNYAPDLSILQNVGSMSNVKKVKPKNKISCFGACLMRTNSNHRNNGKKPKK
ncbi:hypothetical protein BCR32DRAFT_275268 [Anaeromyces robustus]|uniref:Uncharacterized protein n=1 Tax=Anaeromyces robustus TaxID=1754192 RepID=A0A1Y1XLM5_9FUNG|nr:hypothetical protein BCR32DRAFT_275268 [Anaeromyces robustus]|eukprot:ORX86621.1 hypothetical protein BCR32DRAFT_275268 [Anaeromyces robustus]